MTHQQPSNRFQRIVSEYGSPFIAMATEHASTWDTDWQKWKNVEQWRSDVAGFIVQRRGKVKSLVLESDLFTAWVPASRGGVLVRGGSDFKSHKQAEKIVSAVPMRAWKRLRSTLELPSGTLVVFDAGAAGTTDLERLREESAGGVIAVALARGLYALSGAALGGYDLLRLMPFSTRRASGRT